VKDQWYPFAEFSGVNAISLKWFPPKKAELIAPPQSNYSTPSASFKKITFPE
jgi:hypothetical protein